MIRRRLTIVLWSALVLIGLQLASGKAQAHQGQGHAHPAPAAHHVAAHADDANGHNYLSQQVIVPAPAASEVSAARGNDQPDDVAASCNGACCTTGSSCCGHAMTSIPGALGPPHLRGLAIAMRAQPVRPGIDPEALPKPPKFFA